ncbi:MAG: helix-turn-helix domain-containing protein [Clostridia bacterium]|nr:helix-turn-helix domain-containing protein [Clostridia bacterium]MDE7079188.1 helix-turn-helix domain-containing protein [Clostridia bacterium]
MNKRLKQLRLESGKTIKEVANALGMTTSAYAHYEQGRREPSIDILKKICIYFSVSADYLIGLED